MKSRHELEMAFRGKNADRQWTMFGLPRVVFVDNASLDHYVSGTLRPWMQSPKTTDTETINLDNS